MRSRRVSRLTHCACMHLLEQNIQTKSSNIRSFNKRPERRISGTARLRASHRYERAATSANDRLCDVAEVAEGAIENGVVLPLPWPSQRRLDCREVSRADRLDGLGDRVQQKDRRLQHDVVVKIEQAKTDSVVIGFGDRCPSGSIEECRTDEVVAGAKVGVCVVVRKISVARSWRGKWKSNRSLCALGDPNRVVFQKADQIWTQDWSLRSKQRSMVGIRISGFYTACRSRQSCLGYENVIDTLSL